MISFVPTAAPVCYLYVFPLPRGFSPRLCHGCFLVINDHPSTWTSFPTVSTWCSSRISSSTSRYGSFTSDVDSQHGTNTTAEYRSLGTTLWFGTGGGVFWRHQCLLWMHRPTLLRFGRLKTRHFSGHSSRTTNPATPGRSSLANLVNLNLKPRPCGNISRTRRTRPSTCPTSSTFGGFALAAHVSFGALIFYLSSDFLMSTYSFRFASSKLVPIVGLFN